MRALRLASGAVLVALVATLAAVPATAEAPSGAPASATAPAAASAASSRAVEEGPAAKRKRGYVPETGATRTNPRTGPNRPILRKVYRSIRNTAKRQTIRIAVWNIQDRRIVNALIDAQRRGVDVQVLAASTTDNPNWRRLRNRLNARETTGSFARECVGGCRTDARIMHMKFFLFSKIRGARKISMFGSPNLTTAAGERQWNDMVTTRSRQLYDYLETTFKEMRKNRPARPRHYERQRGQYRIWLWPSRRANPIKDQLQKVECRGAENVRNGRTRIRIAIAGWFDAWGYEIARVVRRKWNQGCNIRIVTTLAGRGINRAMNRTGGRGPVPMRQVTIDYNYDGVPDQYLHNKAISIVGHFGQDRKANIVFTGSPNWSERASRSEELLIRIGRAGGMARGYDRYISNLYSSPASHERVQTRASLRRTIADRNLARGIPGKVELPEWFTLE